MLTLHPYPTSSFRSLSANSLLGNLLPSSWSLFLGCPLSSLGFLWVPWSQFPSSVFRHFLSFFSPQHLGVSSVLLIGDRPFCLCPYSFLGGGDYRKKVTQAANGRGSIQIQFHCSSSPGLLCKEDKTFIAGTEEVVGSNTLWVTYKPVALLLGLGTGRKA